MTPKYSVIHQPYTKIPVVKTMSANLNYFYYKYLFIFVFSHQLEVSRPVRAFLRHHLCVISYRCIIIVYKIQIFQSFQSIFYYYCSHSPPMSHGLFLKITKSIIYPGSNGSRYMVGDNTCHNIWRRITHSLDHNRYRDVTIDNIILSENASMPLHSI